MGLDFGLLWVFAVVGVVAAGLLVLVGPGALAYGLAWLLEPRTGIAAGDVAIWVHAGWVGLLLGYAVYLYVDSRHG